MILKHRYLGTYPIVIGGRKLQSDSKNKLKPIIYNLG